jgi:hypothetical protein
MLERGRATRWVTLQPYRLGRGLTRLGQCSGMTANTPAFTLPVGYRPGHELDEAITSNGAAEPLYIGYDGNVVVNSSSNLAAFLDGVTFRAGE